jgi:hypothetical protein
MAPHERVTVIDPQYALGFFKLTKSKIWSVVDTYFRDDDEVLKQAKKLVDGMPPTHVAIAIAGIAQATFGSQGHIIDLEELARDAFITAVYKVVPDYDWSDFDVLEEIEFRKQKEASFVERENTGITDEDDPDFDDKIYTASELQDQNRPFDTRWAEDVGALMDGLFYTSGSGSRVELDMDYGRPLQALLVDAEVRYGYRGTELTQYVLDLLNTLDRLGIATPDDEIRLPSSITL